MLMVYKTLFFVDLGFLLCDIAQGAAFYAVCAFLGMCICIWGIARYE